jgi:hypothetical protein
VQLEHGRATIEALKLAPVRDVHRFECDIVEVLRRPPCRYVATDHRIGERELEPVFVLRGQRDSGLGDVEGVGTVPVVDGLLTVEQVALGHQPARLTEGVVGKATRDVVVVAKLSFVNCCPSIGCCVNPS